MEGSPRIVKKKIITFPNKMYLLYWTVILFFLFLLKPTFRSFFRVLKERKKKNRQSNKYILFGNLIIYSSMLIVVIQSFKGFLKKLNNCSGHIESQSQKN